MLYFVAIAIVIIIIIIILNKATDVSNGYNIQLKDFEKRMQIFYPIGQNYFTINHGVDYYEFFKRQSEQIKIYAYFEKNKIIAVGCGILKLLEKESVWYICDLKVDPEYRGKYLPSKIFLSSLFPNYLYSNKCYGITMNDNNNKVERLSKHMNFLNFKNAGNLYIYKVNYYQMLWMEPLLKTYFGRINYVSLEGIKDLILKDGNRMKILHVNKKMNQSETGIYFSHPIPDYDIMFCCHEDSELKHKLDEMNFRTDITASIIHANMDNYKWDFVQTDEI